MCIVNLVMGGIYHGNGSIWAQKISWVVFCIRFFNSICSIYDAKLDIILGITKKDID